MGVYSKIVIAHEEAVKMFSAALLLLTLLSGALLAVLIVHLVDVFTHPQVSPAVRVNRRALSPR